MKLAATLKIGKSHSVSVAIYNPTSQEMFIKKGTVVGNVSEVNTVIQLPMKKEEKVSAKREGRGVSTNEIGVVDNFDDEEDDEEEKSWEEHLDLSGLTEEQFAEAKQLLLEEHEVFSKSKNDIGHVPSHKKVWYFDKDA